LGEIHIHRLVGRDSYLATVGRLRVAAAVLFGMGNVSAAAAARQAIQVWKPDHLLLVGIAGGFRHSTNDLRLGDVLVADQVIGFELARMTPDGTHRKYELYRPDFDLLTAAKSVAGSEWAPNIMAPRPSGPAGGRTKPEAHFGAVLSGEKVFAYGASIDELRQTWPGAVGVEMESLGVALAAYRGGCGFLMVKGVSDFADETKDDRWRTYAAQAAAHFAAAILRREPIVPR
jgi:nucleoside phosphorylase